MENQTLCQACYNPIQQPSKGRKARYCCDACKQAAYRFRQLGFERQRYSKRTQSDFVPAAPVNGGAFRQLSLRNEVILPFFSELTEIWRIHIKGHRSATIFYGVPSDAELGHLVNYIEEREFLRYDKPQKPSFRNDYQ